MNENIDGEFIANYGKREVKVERKEEATEEIIDSMSDDLTSTAKFKIADNPLTASYNVSFKEVEIDGMVNKALFGIAITRSLK